MRMKESSALKKIFWSFALPLAGGLLGGGAAWRENRKEMLAHRDAFVWEGYTRAMTSQPVFVPDRQTCTTDVRMPPGSRIALVHIEYRDENATWHYRDPAKKPRTLGFFQLTPGDLDMVKKGAEGLRMECTIGTRYDDLLPEPLRDFKPAVAPLPPKPLPRRPRG
jgi:hypothetical protein